MSKGASFGALFFLFLLLLFRFVHVLLYLLDLLLEVGVFGLEAVASIGERLEILLQFEDLGYEFVLLVVFLFFLVFVVLDDVPGLRGSLHGDDTQNKYYRSYLFEFNYITSAWEIRFFAQANSNPCPASTTTRSATSRTSSKYSATITNS